ncbi:hypothetical protein BK131_03610 [Paenibacillus amylolyticus]|uniref:LexA repressor DNA-binding domain-containing protein n=1 Tax=Paenibacillus amylolyticus TaxID=1451 RepID=A0A1R1C4R3_PAEAM|nr:hypothetical protein [Paenibacillus amylolyticus]OMF17071.1 hypothetical protein BK131_03610 [Paenibacillus amylolyticus]
MLSDYERKILRILFNYSSGRRRLPTIHELTVKTGKGKLDVMAALEGLIKAEYINWEDKSDTSNLVILEGWEREVEKPKIPKAPPQVQQNDLSYWTQY